MILSAAAKRFAHAKGKLDPSQAYFTMFDNIVITALPSGTSYCYAGYVNGLWPTYDALRERFPSARILDITVFASGNATAADIESGDLTITEAPAWYERQRARGVWRPVFYISASGQKALEQMMAKCRVARADYRLWVAHYGVGAHICGPGSCGYGLTEADGTQWTRTALGISLDQSILKSDFWLERPAPVTPAPAPEPVPDTTWQEAMLNALPTLSQGDSDVAGRVPYVAMMQGDMRALGTAYAIEAAKDLSVDGVFGTKTCNALLAVQEHFGLHTTDEYTQRVCGPKTWPVLVTGQA